MYKWVWGDGSFCKVKDFFIKVNPLNQEFCSIWPSEIHENYFFTTLFSKQTERSLSFTFFAVVISFGGHRHSSLTTYATGLICPLFLNFTTSISFFEDRIIESYCHARFGQCCALTCLRINPTIYCNFH